MKNITSILLLVLLATQGFTLDTAKDPASPSSPSGPSSPSDPKQPASATPSPSVDQSSGAGIVGTWKVKKGIYDYITILKDVTDSGKDFYSELTILKNGKGKILYNGGTDTVDIEWEMRDQGITIAYGSRLKPQTDLFQVLTMNDGSLFLKSRRLGNVNGSVMYILQKK